MNKEKILINNLKEGLREHEIMRNHTTLRVGGVADFYYEAKTIDDLIKAIKISQKANIPYFVLGDGSNILFSDYGFPGLIIKNLTSNIAFMNEKSQVIVDSGMPLARLILESTSRNLSGIEFLYGVPGTVGGAVYGDAGAFGQAIGDFVKYVTLFLPYEKSKLEHIEIKENQKSKDPRIVQFTRDWMGFSYRSSKIKRTESLQKPIILSVIFQLAQSRQEEIMRRLNMYKEKRIISQPWGQSAGCVFRNPIPAELKNVTGAGSVNMPELPKERTAGFMLERAGAKKLRVGSAKVSPKHANFVLNTNGATAQEIRKLIEQMRSVVREKFDINLEEEIEYVGQW
ncbi:UDP-N-acetylenolpyruvoylglucosamine reductase [Candidatus Berkelbacteria bacterium RBG_13_40_8]|uniref:UDP-N-acetylenolpyruvoylglucosamine reductase n=1 Tax=Candidatus Berkelbacteria bacterium RBG_13_40_8 TaxID=1797467 RepID=A0A1F5DPF3_9BACT|nr:MAG: UDP-N-acetylenolpyruvoylglucosamine reductase [Candidatus Berkelbacteria bacterium RBG_13_40_8]